jgi:streptogramin lyase
MQSRGIIKAVLKGAFIVLTIFPVPGTFASSAWAQATNDLFIASFSTGHLTRLDGSTGATVYDVPQGTSLIDLVKGPDGATLYVSTLFSSSVIRVDLASGAPLGVFASGGGLSTAVGVAFGPDANLYVASRDTSSVIRYDGSTGSFIDTFVPSGSGGLSLTEALLFGPDGNLYVTEISGNRVLRYNGATGAFLGVFATDPSLSGTRSMAFGPDGNLYVAGNSSNNVVRFNGSTGAFMGVFACGIRGPNGLAFGPDGNLYVAAEFANKIIRFEGTSGDVIDRFASVTGPIGIMFDVPPPSPGGLRANYRGGETERSRVGGPVLRKSPQSFGRRRPTALHALCSGALEGQPKLNTTQQD